MPFPKHCKCTICLEGSVLALANAGLTSIQGLDANHGDVLLGVVVTSRAPVVAKRKRWGTWPESGIFVC